MAVLKTTGLSLVDDSGLSPSHFLLLTSETKNLDEGVCIKKYNNNEGRKNITALILILTVQCFSLPQIKQKQKMKTHKLLPNKFNSSRNT